VEESTPFQPGVEGTMDRGPALTLHIHIHTHSCELFIGMAPAVVVVVFEVDRGPIAERGIQPGL